MANPLDPIVSVAISATNATPQLPGFGIPAIVGYHTKNSDVIRSYTDLPGMVTDGFAATDPLYLMASAILSQTPCPPKFKIIRGSTSVTQAGTFIVTSNTNGDSVGFTYTGTDGVAVDYHVTVSSQTTTQVATAIAAITPDATGYAVTSSTATVTVTASAAITIGYVSNVRGGTWLDTTPASSPGTDLTAALAVDPDFYTVTCEHQDATNILAMAVWAEANKRFHVYTTADTANLTATTGVGATLKAAGYAYSFGMYSGFPIGYSALALASQRLTATPGSDTWAYKTLAAVTVDSLTTAQKTALDTNRLNYYVSIANVSVTLTGINASGLCADLRRGIDALGVQIQFNVFVVLVASPKLPFDPGGIAIVGNAIRTALAQFTASPSSPNALLRSDPGFQPVVTLPDISTTTSTDRGNRLLKGIKFGAYAQNAVQTVQIIGVITT